MKNNFQSSLRGTKQSILNFQLLMYLFLAAGCHFEKTTLNSDNREIIDVSSAVVDSTVAPKKMLEQYKRKFAEADNDMSRLEALYKGSYYAEDVPEEKEEYYQLLAKYTDTIPACELKILAYIKLGTIYMQKDISQSFVCYQTALELIPKFPENSKILKAQTLAHMAYTCYMSGDFEQALQYVMESIPVLEAQRKKVSLP